MRPLIGITTDFVDSRYRTKKAYVDMVLAAGGTPVLLPQTAESPAALLQRLDGVVLSGGGDIDTRKFGTPLHAEAECMDPLRQAGEFALLKALDEVRELPVLGICLGMQLMGVHAGARLIQHVPDEYSGVQHADDARHTVECSFGNGVVTSAHHQGLADAGTLKITGRAADGLIEAIADPARLFYVGVQWHPERTTGETLGLKILCALVEAADRHRKG